MEGEEKLIWNTLKSIDSRLTGIESELREVVRLQEITSNHHDAIGHNSYKISKHEDRIRELENESWTNKGRDVSERKLVSWIAGIISVVVTTVITLFLKNHS